MHNIYFFSSKNSEQTSDQQGYEEEVVTEVTQDYEDVDNPDRLYGEIEMRPNVVYGAGDQR